MTLYHVQKLIYNLNRDAKLVERFKTDMDSVLGDYELNEEELEAIREPNVQEVLKQSENAKYCDSREPQSLLETFFNIG